MMKKQGDCGEARTTVLLIMETNIEEEQGKFLLVFRFNKIISHFFF